MVHLFTDRVSLEAKNDFEPTTFPPRLKITGVNHHVW